MTCKSKMTIQGPGSLYINSSMYSHSLKRNILQKTLLSKVFSYVAFILLIGQGDLFTINTIDYADIHYQMSRCQNF